MVRLKGGGRFLGREAVVLVLSVQPASRRQITAKETGRAGRMRECYLNKRDAARASDPALNPPPFSSRGEI